MWKGEGCVWGGGSVVVRVVETEKPNVMIIIIMIKDSSFFVVGNHFKTTAGIQLVMLIQKHVSVCSSSLTVSVAVRSRHCARACRISIKTNS